MQDQPRGAAPILTRPTPLRFRATRIAQSILVVMPAVPLQAVAAEGAIFGGTVGGTDIRSSYLPAQTGLYIGAVTIPGFAASSNGDNGRNNPALRNLNLGFDFTALGALYVYPFKLLGGALASSMQVPYYDYARFSVNGRTDDIAGWGDIYSDLLTWSRYVGQLGAHVPSDANEPHLPYGLTIKLAYSMIFPSGAYNTRRPIR